MEKYYNPATGFSYSYEEVLAEAEENKMSFEDFISENSLELKQEEETPQEDPLTASIDARAEQDFQTDLQEGVPVGPVQEPTPFSLDSSGEIMTSGLEGKDASVEQWLEATEAGITNNPEWDTGEVMRWESRQGGPSQDDIDFYKKKEILENVADEPTDFILDLYNDVGNDFSSYSDTGGFDEMMGENPKSFNHPINQQINYLQSKLSRRRKSYTTYADDKEKEIQGEITRLKKERDSLVSESETTADKIFDYNVGLEIAVEGGNEREIDKATNNTPKGITKKQVDYYNELLSEATTAYIRDDNSSRDGVYQGTASEWENQTGEEASLSLGTQKNIVNLLQKEDYTDLRRKLSNGNATIQEKENLIIDAKSLTLNEEIGKLGEEFDKAYDTLYEHQDLKSIPKEEFDKLKLVAEDIENQKQKVFLDIGFNAVKSSFNNEFAMTDAISAWNNQNYDTEGLIKDNFLGGSLDFGATLGEGVGKIALESTVGFGVWAATGILNTVEKATGLDIDQGGADIVSDWLNKNIFDFDILPKSETGGMSSRTWAGRSEALGGEGTNKGSNLRFGSKTFAELLPFSLGVMHAAKKGDIKGVEKMMGLLKPGKNLVKRAKKAQQTYVMGKFAFKATANQNYREGLDMGLDPFEASLYSSSVSFGTALSQAIMPDINFIKGGAKALTNTSLKKGLVTNLKQVAGNVGKKTVAKSYITNIGLEVLEEEADLAWKKLTELSMGLSDSTQLWDAEEQYQTIQGTIILAGTMGLAGSANTYAGAKKVIYNQYRSQGADIITNLGNLREMALKKANRKNASVGSKAAAETELKQINDALVYGQDIMNAINVSADLMSDSQLDLLVQKEQLIRSKKGVDKSAAAATDEQIKNIDDQIINSSISKNQESIYEKQTKNVKKISEDLDVGFIEGDTKTVTDEVNRQNKEITKRNALKKEGEKKEDLISLKEAEENGIIQQNPDGTQNIIINRDIAKTNKAVTTAQHELLHAVLLKTIKSNPGAVQAMSGALKSEIDKMVENVPGSADAYLKTRLSAYATDPSSIQAEEMLTIFSEGITQGYIAFEENAFTKIGDKVRQVLQDMGMNVTFNNGKDVYNFIKDFNKGVKKGKLGKGLTEVATKGVKVGISVNPFKSDAAFDEQIQNIFNSGTVFNGKPTNSPEIKAYQTAMLFRNKVQALIAVGKNGMGSSMEARQLLNEILLGENANSVKNITLNYNPESGKSLSDTIGEAIGAFAGLSSENAKNIKRSRGDLYSRVKDIYGPLDSFKDKTEKQKSDAASLIGFEYTDVVNKKLKKYNTLEGFNTNKDNIIADATYAPGKGGVYDLVRTFNKDGKQIINQEINAYIQGLLDNRVLGVVLSYKLGKDFSAGQASDLKGLVDNSPKIKPDALKFPSITQAKTFSPEVYDEVKTKVLQTVRVLKSKVDSKTSINKRSTELVSEIKQSISRSADAVIKNAMGGKANNKLKNFLLKTKKQTLENFTTTWLMGQDTGTKVNGGMPQAIQKSVGGKYLLNKDGKRLKNDYGDFVFEPNFISYPAWVGKEIDRVKTSTDAAGQTSGNQLVRRIPNVNGRISNEIYLSNILKEDGTPIRGRKEAYAKEMAGELGLEIFFDQANIDSDVSRAFEKNQEMLGAMIGDNLISTLETQIERGNIKRSASSTMEMQAQLVELMSDAIKNGTDSATFDNIIMETDPKVVEAARELGILSLFDSGKTGFKAPLIAWNNFPIIFKDQMDLYQSTITSKVSEQSMEQLAAFSNKMIDILPPEVLAAIPDDMLGIQRGYLDGAENTNNNRPSGKYVEIARKKRAKQKQSPTNTELTFNPKDIRIFNAGSGIMGQIGTILDKAISKKNKLILINKEFGEIIAKANVANIAALEYLMDKATEVMVSNPDLVTGYMRWMESSTSNAKAQRGLTTLDMLDVRDGSQKASEAHPDYADALIFATEAAEKAWTKLSKPKKALTTKEEFVKERLENPKTGALKHLRYKGEHVNPAANVMLDLAKVSLLTASKIIRTPTLTGPGHNVFRAEANLKYKQILTNYSQTLGVELYSAIQDEKLGTTSALQDFRGLALEQDQLGNFVTLEGVQAINYIQRKLLSLESIEKVISDINFNTLAIVEATEDSAIKEVKEDSIKRSKSIGDAFNVILQENKGVDAKKRFSDVVAKRKGNNKGWWKLILPPSAEDFRGLLNVFTGKGELGNKQQKFFIDNLITPYTKGVARIESYRQALINDYTKLLKTFPQVKKQLGKTIPDGDFTFDQAIRVYLYTKSGFEIPGISKRDAEKLNRLVEGDESLSSFADTALLVSKKSKWSEPSGYWDSGSILSDLSNLTEKVGRKEFLAEFIGNSNSIFSKENLNKIEAIYGTNVRSALEDSLYRMINGTNRPSGSNRMTNRFNNWVNNSVGAIMFFNRKSALLQLLSTVNFMNWSDNNPAKAAAAFANQPQFWKDFSMLWNSDKLKQRRSGLRSDINEAEIANAAKGATNKANAAISYLLKIGFTPTQLADSFAIASGGASMYRNRVNTYLKQGMELKQAEAKAFEDFSLISDETQQSADPMLISEQQASMLGRFLLAFQNTPMQMTRLMKKAGQMLINRRKYPDQSQFQSDTTNISKIVYYGAIQNFVFSALQNALFALAPGFMDDEDEEDVDEKRQKLINTKTERIVNSMADTLLRGSGVYGAIISTIKNVINEYYTQEEKGFTADHTYTMLQATNLSPAVGSKLRKVYSGIQTSKFEKDVIAERGWDATINGRLNLSPKYSILGSVTEALTNLPLERAVIELTSIVEALDARNTAMQRIAMGLGYRSWGVGAKNEEHDIIKTLAKIRRKEEGKVKAKATRKANKIKEKKELDAMSIMQRDSVFRLKRKLAKEKKEGNSDSDIYKYGGNQ